MHIVFHGENAGTFGKGFDALMEIPCTTSFLPDTLSDKDRAVYERADVIVGVRYGADLPYPAQLRLFHVPGAGFDAVDLKLLPESAVVCNCFGHEQSIAEYVMGAILARHLPLADADARLRRGEWAYRAGAASRAHDEVAGKAIGLLGFGHIGKAIARRAKAFEMQVNVANRSPVPPGEFVDQAFRLSELEKFWASSDYIVSSLPMAPDTEGIVDGRAFSAMRRSAVFMNVGRGPTVDQHALYDALKNGQIAGAVIDTWYVYPKDAASRTLPAQLPFQDLPNIVMTPHMSGWSYGTIRRRQQTIADNILRCFGGRECVNVVRDASEKQAGLS